MRTTFRRSNSMDECSRRPVSLWNLLVRLTSNWRERGDSFERARRSNRHSELELFHQIRLDFALHGLSLFGDRRIIGVWFLAHGCPVDFRSPLHGELRLWFIAGGSLLQVGAVSRMVIGVQGQTRCDLEFGMTFLEELLDKLILRGIPFLEIALAHSFGWSETEWDAVLIGQFGVQVVEDLGIECSLLLLFRLCLRGLLQVLCQGAFLLGVVAGEPLRSSAILHVIFDQVSKLTRFILAGILFGSHSLLNQRPHPYILDAVVHAFAIFRLNPRILAGLRPHLYDLPNLLLFFILLADFPLFFALEFDFKLLDHRDHP